MRTLRKVLSVLLLLVIVPVVMAQVALYSVRSLLTDPTFPKQVMREAGVQAAVAEAIAQRIWSEGTEAGLPVSRERVARIVNQVLAAARVDRIGDQVIDGLYAWAWGPNPVPVLVVDLSEMRRNLPPVVRAELETEIESLPACTKEQMRQILTRSEAGLPPCKTSDPKLNAAVVNQIMQHLNLERVLPDRIDLAAVMAGQEGRTFWEDRWADLHWIRLALNLVIWGWAGVTVLLLLLALLNLDHWHTPFAWGGAALTAGSAPLLLIAMGGMRVALPAVERALPDQDAVGAGVVAAILGGVSVALRSVSLLVMLVGLAAIAIAVYGAVTDQPPEGPGASTSA